MHLGSDMLSRRALVVLLIVGSLPVEAQPIDGWVAHANFSGSQSMVTIGTDVWVGTTGGLYHRAGSGEYERYDLSLHQNDVRALAYDPRQEALWLGFADGVLTRMSLETGEMASFFDIRRARQFPTRSITSLRWYDGTIIAATAFGIVVVDAQRGDVIASYTRMADLPPATAVIDVTIAQDSIFVLTGFGVASASLVENLNLQDPLSWSQAPVPAQGDARRLAYHAGTIYVGTSEDLFRYNRSTRVYEPLGIGGHGVVSSCGVYKGLSYVQTNWFTVALSSSGQATIVPTQEAGEDLQTCSIDETGVLWIGDAAAGISAYDLGRQSFLVKRSYPDGPSMGPFSRLEWQSGGGLAAGSAVGVATLQADGSWVNLLRSEVQGINGSFFRALAFHDGAWWMGSEGGGVMVASPGSTAISTYNHTNATLEPADGTTSYVIVSGLARDDSGAIWVSQTGAAHGLHVYDDTGVWSALGPYTGQGLTTATQSFDRIYIDQFDHKWIVVRDERNFKLYRGLMVLDSGEDPRRDDDDVFRYFNAVGAAGQGLPSTTVTAIAEDLDGRLWVATTAGLAYFINTSFIADDPQSIPLWPLWKDRSLGAYALYGLVVNDLYIDPANTMWVASNEGLWQLKYEEGGLVLLRQYDTANSPLPSDQILALTADTERGMLYVATTGGLVQLTSGATRASARESALRVYPNPYYLSSGSAGITIDGLVDRALVRVTSITGEVIAQFSTRGGRLVWDGRDVRGAMVAPGMYLVVSMSEDGAGVAYGRLAVLP